MAGQHYCLRWNNYQSNMTSVFHHLLRTEAFVDVTLACNNDSLKAHKVVLSACSSYFQKILLDNPSQHPTIIMPADVCFTDLKFIIEFVYRGEIDVSQAELQSLLKTADQLKIKGLCEVPEGTDTKDMPGAEVTPLPPRPASPPQLPPSTISAAARAHKFRRLTVQAKRRLDTKRRLYRENPQQKQQVEELPQVHQTQTIHQPQQQMLQNHQSHQLQHQTQQNLHQNQQTNHNVHHQQNIHQQTLHQQNIHQTQQNMHQTQQNMHQTQQSIHQTQNTQTQVHQMNTHQQNVHIVQQQTLHQTQQSMHQTTQQHLQTQHMTQNHTHQESAQQTQMIQAVVTTVHDPSNQHNQVLLESSGLSVHSDVDSLTADVGTQNTSPTSSSLLASPQHHQEMTVLTPVEGRVTVDTSPLSQGHDGEDVKVKFETLRAMEQTDALDMDAHMSAAERKQENGEESVEHTMHTMMITPELLGLMPSNTPGHQAEVSDCPKRDATTSKTWTQEDMDAALEALRNHTMSLTKASITFGIPSTTLWQRAHRLGIDTPKKDGPAKSWTEDVLNVALEALRNGSISANKASKAYGIPSSTLYKIARREGIRLAAPFNAAPTTWTPEHLERALEAIRSGQTTVQRAAADFGIPSGTLYGRCKREGIELSRSNPTPWSEDAMTEALEAVRLGQMSINQAAIHYNLPYSSLYGRFKRVKYEADHPSAGENEELPLVTHHSLPGQIMLVQYQQPTLYQHTPS
ncbi:longitudinals lacking protein, isoforms F/I/K/T-like isoform X4 [Macrosteles quadrilineatus]|uniref:longitudinals lacking protein, isoforms F/I/K/T-like isoform X4 n=1 Tax=Macrosteles quadrilineatus TaxID=74068 RepID=UPI0023E2C31E|nr:longitudinals lacking protein, isoforms F/I/K/T-like isoform X4 [Macrosteles quadrilineatus]